MLITFTIKKKIYKATTLLKTLSDTQFSEKLFYVWCFAVNSNEVLWARALGKHLLAPKGCGAQRGSWFSTWSWLSHCYSRPWFPHLQIKSISSTELCISGQGCVLLAKPRLRFHNNILTCWEWPCLMRTMSHSPISHLEFSTFSDIISPTINLKQEGQRVSTT